MPSVIAPALLLVMSVSAEPFPQAPAARPESRSYSVRANGLLPISAPSPSLVSTAEVQRELKLTEPQKQRHTALIQQERDTAQKARETYLDREIFQAALNGLLDDTDSALREVLSPIQRERLRQIQLQAEGPLAFERRDWERNSEWK
jgi:hypothetical protein